jgi:hypothetical protein
MWAITLDKILEHMRCVDSRFPIQEKAPLERLKLAIHTKSVVAVYAKP